MEKYSTKIEKDTRDELLTLTREQLRVAVDLFESDFVNRRISEIKRSFAIQIGYHIFILVCGIMTNLNPTWNSMIGSLGLGYLCVKVNYNEAQNTWQKYQKDTRIIKDLLFIIKLKLEMADDDPERLKEVENLLLAGVR